MELEQLTPVPDDELERAADLLQNFRKHWERLEGDEESRHELVKLIVERVYVYDDRVVAMTLRSNYHLVLNHKTNEPTEFSVGSFLSASGSDGLGYLSGHRCIVLPSSINSPVFIRYLLKHYKIEHPTGQKMVAPIVR